MFEQGQEKYFVTELSSALLPPTLKKKKNNTSYFPSQPTIANFSKNKSAER